MTQSQPLMWEAGQGDSEASAERRRARILSRILESNERLQGQFDAPVILREMVGLIQSLFAECSILVMARQGRNSTSDLRVFHSDFDAGEQAFIERLAREVVTTGVVPFAVEYEVTRDGSAACAPLCRPKDALQGAVYVALPSDCPISSEELGFYLRAIGGQAGLALHAAWRLEKLSEDLALLSADSGVDFSSEDLALSEAKRAFERWFIKARLSATSGNIAAAARLLSMDRGQLSRLVKRHGIDASSFRS